MREDDLERITHGNGAGRIIVDFYLADPTPPWDSILRHKQKIIRKTEKQFRAALEGAGFLDPRR